MSEQGIRIEHKNNNLVIRSATLEDASLLTTWWNDGTVMAHAGFPLGLNQTIEETKKQIESNFSRLSQLCIIESNNYRIGEVSFGIGEGYAEIGIKLCESTYQNKGLGTIVLQMLIEFLFHDPKLNQNTQIERIILDTNLTNLRAQHVYENLGFKRLSIHYNAWEDQLGTLQSCIDYELTRAQYEDGVRYIIDPEEKEEIARTILNALPDWFGIPENTEEYIIKSKELPFFAYYKDNQYVGFITLKETSPYTAELFVMGVLKTYHHQKIGTKLFHQFTRYTQSKNYEFIQVKTVDAGHYEEYDKTRLFYEQMGFKKLETFPTLWDEWNPCLIMIQSIKKSSKEE